MRWRLVLLLGILLMATLAAFAILAPSTEDPHLFPNVYIHPGATAYEVTPARLAGIHVPGETTADVLAWYAATLPTLGWEPVPTPLPEDQVRLFAREGRYLSLAAGQPPGDKGIVRLHLRATPEVTAEEAKAIAAAFDRSRVRWVAEERTESAPSAYIPMAKHPIWVVRGYRGGKIRTVVYVDAISAHPYRITVIDQGASRDEGGSGGV